MSSPSVSISTAVEGVCFLCGNEGPVFEASTSCGRFSAVPLCSKDLFAIVTAQNRNAAAAGRGPTRGRGKAVPKNRSAGDDDIHFPPGNAPDDGLPSAAA